MGGTNRGWIWWALEGKIFHIGPETSVCSTHSYFTSMLRKCKGSGFDKVRWRGLWSLWWSQYPETEKCIVQTRAPTGPSMWLVNSPCIPHSVYMSSTTLWWCWKLPSTIWKEILEKAWFFPSGKLNFNNRIQIEISHFQCSNAPAWCAKFSHQPPGSSTLWRSTWLVAKVPWKKFRHKSALTFFFRSHVVSKFIYIFFFSQERSNWNWIYIYIYII